jgi:hypothetical protein
MLPITRSMDPGIIQGRRRTSHDCCRPGAHGATLSCTSAMTRPRPNPPIGQVRRATSSSAKSPRWRMRLSFRSEPTVPSSVPIWSTPCAAQDSTPWWLPASAPIIPSKPRFAWRATWDFTPISSPTPALHSRGQIFGGACVAPRRFIPCLWQILMVNTARSSTPGICCRAAPHDR